MKRKGIIILLISAVMLTSCYRDVTVTGAGTTAEVYMTENAAATEADSVIKETEENIYTEEISTVSEISEMNELTLEIDSVKIPVTWEDNESVEALKELCETEPLVITMSMYGGFEQVGSIGYDLPRDDEQITTECGDIVLYSGDQIVLFYGSNSWSYTRLGKMGLSEKELTDILGYEEVSIVLSMT